MSKQSFFQFETDFIESLRCIPMVVRMKLDTCGVKLKLEHWHKFNSLEKQALIAKPCSSPQEVTSYHDWVQDLITAKTGKPATELPVDPNPLWLHGEQIPEAVTNKAAEFKIVLSPQKWSSLTPLQRFALIKLSRPSHENNNFIPALKEFDL